MKNPKNAVPYLLITSFLLVACAIPFISGAESAPENTQAPSSTETSAPAAESIPTETAAMPTATEAAPEPEPESEAASPEPAAPSGDCYNPYFPVLPDKTWHYHTDTAGLPSTDQYQTYEDIRPDSFIAKQEIVSETTFYTEVDWFCSEEGLVTAEVAMINLPDLPADFNFESGEFSGVSYPPAEEWVIGHTWTGNWQMTGTAEIPNVGTTTSDVTVMQENTIVAIEPVTVPAGSYEEAVRIDSSLTIEVVADVGGVSSPPVSNTFTISAWYVRDVGLVKQTSDDMGFLMVLQSLE